MNQLLWQCNSCSSVMEAPPNTTASAIPPPHCCGLMSVTTSQVAMINVLVDIKDVMERTLEQMRRG